MLERSPVLAICGTRPEAIKMAPVVDALRQIGRPVQIVDTGQHPDLLPMVLREAGLQAGHELRVARPGMAPQAMLAAIVAALAPLLAAVRPPLVVVQGDTVSAFAGALAAAYAGIPVAHVEAGLRTDDPAEPFPEELQRALIGRLAHLHFAPTIRARAALLREGVAPARIHVTGNTGIDAFHQILARVDGDSALDAQMSAHLPLAVRDHLPLLVATVHRRENHGERLAAIADGLADIAGQRLARVVVPLHPNPLVQTALAARLRGLADVQLVAALDHRAMAWLMLHADVLLTDSGGLQEEAPSLGLPTLVLRRATERQEAVDAGLARLVDLHPAAICRAVKETLARPRPEPAFPFGDGHAGRRIAALIDEWLDDVASADEMAGTIAGSGKTATPARARTA